jgi:two-component system, NarL family, response regulator NreC
VIRIVLADDHAIVRHGLRTLLQSEPDLEVVGEVGDGPSALRVVREHDPDVVILDIGLPGLGGLDVARQLARGARRTRVLVLSIHAAEPYVLEALRNGVAGYALKDTPTQDLVRAVRQVAAGRRYLSPALSDRAIEAYIERTTSESALDPFESLTPRERDVLHLAAHGQSNAAMAASMSISPRTVEVHRGSFMRKLGLRTQTDLIRYALRHGIIPVES